MNPSTVKMTCGCVTYPVRLSAGCFSKGINFFAITRNRLWRLLIFCLMVRGDYSPSSTDGVKYDCAREKLKCEC